MFENCNADFLRISQIVAAGLCGATISLLQEQDQSKRVLRSCREFTGMVKQQVGKQSWYQRRIAWMQKNGVSFHYGKKITPTKLLLAQICMGAVGGFLGGAVGLTDALVGGGVCGILLFLLPVLLIPYLNRRDNEQMLPELRLVYHALAMQIKAGVFVTDALAECYNAVQDKRLKAALLELAGDIVMKSDLFQALDRFQKKFDNRYIDSLCITVLQAMESGKAVELLGDIAEQVKDMEATVLSRKKGRLDRSLTFYQLGMLTAVLAVSIWGCVSYMMQAAVSL